MITSEYTGKNPERKNNGTPIFVNGRAVGRVIVDTFEKTISGSIHIYHRFDAIAFEVSSLNDARAAGAKWVKVTDREDGTIYRASIDTILTKGIPIPKTKQIGLPRDKWMQSRKGQPEQRSLFEGM